MAKKLIALRLDAALAADLAARAKAQHTTVTAIITAALADRPAQPSPPLRQTRHTGVFEDVQPELKVPVQDLQPTAADPGCRRCHHAISKHYGSSTAPQRRCNVMGCACPRLLD